MGILKIAEPLKGNIYDTLLLENEEGTIVLEMNQVNRIERLDKERYFMDWWKKGRMDWRTMMRIKNTGGTQENEHYRYFLQQ